MKKHGQQKTYRIHSHIERSRLHLPTTNRFIIIKLNISITKGTPIKNQKLYQRKITKNKSSQETHQQIQLPKHRPFLQITHKL